MSLQTKLLPQIRNEFPRAATDASGRTRIFLDTGAGSLVLKKAADAEAYTMLNLSSNLGLPAWESQKAEEVILEARKAASDFRRP